MSVSIKEVKTSGDLKKFIEFNYKLYKGNEYAVPELYMDLKNTFNPEKNAALDFCDFQLFLAYKEGKIVGRVAAIINKRANEAWNTSNVRFGWIDFVDDTEVSKALIDAVEKWGKERGMTNIQGPLGFTDFDREGMLVEGFDQIGTMATYYNYPYYPEHMERMGFEKEVDWLERRLFMPDAMPERYVRIGELVAKRSNLHVKKLKNFKEVKEGGYGQRMFEVINDGYSKLFGFSRLSEKQIDQLVDSYLPLVDLSIQCVVMNEKEEMIAVGLLMPSLARALQKSGGKLFPFGWWHLIKALKWKHDEGIELLLIAVRHDYQGKGVNAMIINNIIPQLHSMGYKWAETNPILESNNLSADQWDVLPQKQHKRRRCYIKGI